MRAPAARRLRALQSGLRATHGTGDSAYDETERHFDDCSASWYAADIALALRDLFAQDGVDLSHPSLRAFIGGYAQRFPIAEEAVAQLPTWLRLANLTIYARLMWALDLPASGEYPEWVAEVEANLKRWMENYTASLPASAQ